MDRAEFLARIRARRGEALPEVPVPSDWAIAIDDPVGRFEEELDAVDGDFHLSDAPGAARVVAEIVASAGRDTRPLVLVTREEGVPEDLDVALAEAGADVAVWPEAGLEAAARADAGVTSALWAVAETGSIVVSSFPPAGRAPSLLPPVHIAVVPAARLLSTVADLFVEVERLAPRPSNLVVVTGPSKSADIGMELARGVHGPGEVHVVLVGA